MSKIPDALRDRIVKLVRRGEDSKRIGKLIGVSSRTVGAVKANQTRGPSGRHMAAIKAHQTRGAVGRRLRMRPRKKQSSVPQSESLRSRVVDYAERIGPSARILITSASDTSRSYSILEQTLKHGAQEFPKVVSWPTGTRKGTVWWHPRQKFWVAFFPNVDKKHYLIMFGLEHPAKRGNLNVRCEINPPRESVNRRCGGVFVRDLAGNVFLGHRGKIGGGKRGIGKNAFWKAYKGNKARSGSFHRGRLVEDEVIVLGRIDNPNLLSSISRFTLQVDDFKRGLNRPRPAYNLRGRRGSLRFNRYKQTYAYVTGRREREVVPGHHNFQFRLRRYLLSRGVFPEFERDFVDVAFEVNGKRYIGEIKVTGALNINTAFRLALGQILEYEFIKFPKTSMVMFFDETPDNARVSLATRLGIAVIIERQKKYELCNPSVAPKLKPIFKVS